MVPSSSSTAEPFRPCEARHFRSVRGGARADLDAHFEQPYMKALLARVPELVDGDVEISVAGRV